LLTRGKLRASGVTEAFTRSATGQLRGIAAALTRATQIPGNYGHAPDTASISGRGMLVWACTALALELAAAGLAQAGLTILPAILWAGGLIVLAGAVIDESWLGPSTRHTARRLIRWNTPGGWIVAMPLAAAVCLAICPAHVLNPEIARALVRSVLQPVDPEAMVRLVDPASLYFGIILLKLGPPLGVLTLAAIVWACLQQGRSGLTLPGPALTDATLIQPRMGLLSIAVRRKPTGSSRPT
jgi:hypothetical protein